MPFNKPSIFPNPFSPRAKALYFKVRSGLFKSAIICNSPRIRTRACPSKSLFLFPLQPFSGFVSLLDVRVLIRLREMYDYLV